MLGTEKSQENIIQMEALQCPMSSAEANEPEKVTIKDGPWSSTEMFKFVAYLIHNRQILKLKIQRRTSKIFKQMALFVGSRTPVQCRSQNQRLFRKHRTFRYIVENFKEEYGHSNFEIDYETVTANPAIKFKTEYENYLESKAKVSSDACIQTEESIVQTANSGFSWASPSTNTMSYQQFQYLGANWVFIPFCS